MMARIIEEAEASPFYAPPPSRARAHHVARRSRAPPCNIAREVGARVLVAFTESGGTPRLISKARPGVPIVAFASDEVSLRPLALYWGVVPRLLALPAGPDATTLVEHVTRALVDLRMVEAGDRVVVALGTPIGQRAPTNTVTVVTV